MASKISVAQTRRRTAHFATGQPSELPASVLPLEVDGGFGTSGPKSLQGPLGQAITLPDYHLKPVVRFAAVSSPDLPCLPDEIRI